MRRKKPEDQMMEEAIEKASQLINLLQKENSDLKRKTERSQKEAQVLKKQIRQLKQRYEIQSKQNAKNAQLLSNKTSQLKKLEEALFQSEQQLKKRTHNNKELHQKISVLTAKLKQKSKQFNEQRTMYLSLQNQNEYLLKKIGKEEDKQNQTNNKLKEIISQKQIQIKEVIKLKEAFSRRCEELKADNASLIEAAASYKQRAIENIPQPVLPNTKHILVKHNRTFSQRPPLPGSQILVKLIEQKLGVKPQSSLEKQLEQLSNFISYRFDHIQKLWQGIHSKMQEKEIMKISNLKELLVASQRISTYLNELISCQP